MPAFAGRIIRNVTTLGELTADTECKGSDDPAYTVMYSFFRPFCAAKLLVSLSVSPSMS